MSTLWRAFAGTLPATGAHPVRANVILVSVIVTAGVRAVRGSSRGMALSGFGSLTMGIAILLVRHAGLAAPIHEWARMITFSVGFLTAGILALLSIRPYARWRASRVEPRESLPT